MNRGDGDEAIDGRITGHVRGPDAYRRKTSNQTQGTYQLKADLGDLVLHQVNVSLKAP